MDYITALFEHIKGNKVTISCYQEEDEIRGLFERFGVEIEFVKSEAALRENFNPLKRQQDIILEQDGKVYFVPYLLLKYEKELEGAKSLADGLDPGQKQAFHNLTGYAVTRDLKYLTRIIKSGFNPDLAVFKELNAAINENGVNLVRMENVAEMMKTPCAGYDVLDETPTSGQVVRKLNHVVPSIRKNIIFIHLESISNEVYYNNLDCFPNLAKLMSHSLHLKNFYSSASSSAMALMDLFYGNDFENDRFAVFDEMNTENTYCRHLFETLSENGYEILGAGCNEIVEEMNRFGLWGFHKTPYEWTNDFEGFIECIQSFLKKTSRPFAAHLWNVLPHIGHNNDKIREGKGYAERMRRSYEYLDVMVARIMEALEALGFLDDTIIIGYGDHGDDKWSRSMNSGFTHITAPYLNLVKTPAFIYDKRIGERMFKGVASMIDLKPTVLYLTGIDNKESFPYQGVNIFENKNDFVFSRSLLTNQREREKLQTDWIIRLNNYSDTEHKTKAFNIIGKDYNLLVSSCGMEFFFHSTDPGNYNNLLDFLVTDEIGEIVRFNNHGAWRGHFRTIVMEDDQIFHAMYHYYTMRDLLRERIGLKNSMIDTEEKNFFDMEGFNKTRERGFLWA